MNPKPIPKITKELLEWAEKTFPDRCPEPSMSDREIWMASGAAKVVKKLRSLFEEQQRNLLGPTD